METFIQGNVVSDIREQQMEKVRVLSRYGINCSLLSIRNFIKCHMNKLFIVKVENH